jgi:DNA-binding response OmpR family regulator
MMLYWLKRQQEVRSGKLFSRYRYHSRASLSFLASYDYQFILLDLGLPDRNGLEILKSLRRKKNKVGVIILTAQDQIQERIAGLDAGADDFVIKPYDLYEVIARIQAVLRRISGEASDLFR